MYAAVGPSKRARPAIARGLDDGACRAKALFTAADYRQILCVTPAASGTDSLRLPCVVTTNWSGVRERVEALAREDTARVVFGAWNLRGTHGHQFRVLRRSRKNRSARPRHNFGSPCRRTR